MCAVSVILSSATALVAIVLLARWEAWKHDERARCEDYSVNDWLDGRPEASPEVEPPLYADSPELGRDDSAPRKPDYRHAEPAAPTGDSRAPDTREHNGRGYVTVDTIKARIRRETAETTRWSAIGHTAPLRVRPRPRPSPYPKGGRRASQD